MTGVEGHAISRGSIGPASYAMQPASTAFAERLRHADRIARSRDGCVDQHGIESQLHRLRCVRRQRRCRRR